MFDEVLYIMRNILLKFRTIGLSSFKGEDCVLYDEESTHAL